MFLQLGHFEWCCCSIRNIFLGGGGEVVILQVGVVAYLTQKWGFELPCKFE
jgi:hypothetical protein